MLRAVFFAISLLVSASLQAHDFYFAYAEIEVDDMNHKIEATVSVTTHDLEKALAINGISTKKLSGNEGDTAFLQILQSEISKGFSVRVGEEAIQFKLEGYEVQLNGITHFYLSADYTNDSAIIQLSFDLLMEEFPAQQNKATLLFRGKKKTTEFLPHRRIQTINLSEL